MPKEIELDDGTKETVYTEDEVKGYKQGAVKNKERKETLSNFSKEVGAKEGQTIEEKLQEFKENANPNFGKYRAKGKADAKKLKELGFEHDDDGNLINGDKPVTAEEIKKQINEGITSAMSTTEKDKVLSQYKEEDSKVVEHYLNKLMATGGTLKDNVPIAEALAFPGQNISDVKIANNNLGGQPPTNAGDKGDKGFSETPEGQEMLKEIVPEAIKKDKK